MSSALPILQGLSIVCSSIALALFVYWVIENVGRQYERGRAVAVRQPDASEVQIVGSDVPLVEALRPAAAVFLPTIERWHETNRFGVASYLEDYDRRLLQAGLRAKLSPEYFLACSILAGLFAAGVIGMLALAAIFLQSSLLTLIVVMVPIAAVAGFFGPVLVLGNVISNRLALIEKRLPFAIEFIVLAMEARAAFPAAMEIYCDQLRGDPLAEELGDVLRGIRYGLSTQAALWQLAERVRSIDLSAFVLAVNAGLETGQPIKSVLEVQSDVARERRFQSAERVAKTASTRATFPLMLVALAIILLLLGPIVIRFASSPAW